jgi:hypothetical protein
MIHGTVHLQWMCSFQPSRTHKANCVHFASKTVGCEVWPEVICMIYARPFPGFGFGTGWWRNYAKKYRLTECFPHSLSFSWFNVKSGGSDGRGRNLIGKMVRFHTNWLICKLIVEWIHGNNSVCRLVGWGGGGSSLSLTSERTARCFLISFLFVLVSSVLLWKRNVIPHHITKWIKKILMCVVSIDINVTLRSSGRFVL